MARSFTLRRLTLLVVIGLALLGVWRYRSSGGSITNFRLAEVSKGDITVTISATGTVEPEEVINVGAQVAGLISAFGKDKNGKQLDYGSEVEEGGILAQIDDSLYKTDVAQAEAQLKHSQADVLQMKAKLSQADRDWKRAQKLTNSEAISQSSVDAYRAAYDTAQANLAVADAELAQSVAALEKAKRNLGYCTITSPVRGVIIDRRVNIGQTVVSSLNAPSLFLLAKDLRRMQVWVSVNEADIGNIRLGQPVTFTVEAFPGEVFHGEVAKIRLNATMTQNVVNYTVEVTTDNSSGRLLPYLTANVRFEVSKASGVMLVPNAALRWTPAADLVSPEEKSAKGKRDRGATEAKSEGAAEKSSERGLIWLPDGKFVSSRRVQILGTDGVVTQIQGEVEEGAKVVIGVERAEDTAKGSTNPFAVQMPNRRNGMGGGRGGR